MSNTVPTTRSLPAMRLVGLETRTSNADEFDPARARIGALWGRFFADGIATRVRPSATALIIAAYHRYESDHNGAYSLLIGGEPDPAAVVADLVALEVPAARYLVFNAHGPMPQALIATWMEIWAYFETPAAPKRAYTIDLELHLPTLPGEDGMVEVCIAVR